MAKKRARHGNRLDNDNDHHLYAIYDHGRRTIYKFGISDDPVEQGALPDRLRKQVSLFNRVVGSLRYAGRVLLSGIRGRRRARRREDEMVRKYQKKYGDFPPGNEDHRFLK